MSRIQCKKKNSTLKFKVNFEASSFWKCRIYLTFLSTLYIPACVCLPRHSVYGCAPLSLSQRGFFRFASRIYMVTNERSREFRVFHGRLFRGTVDATWQFREHFRGKLRRPSWPSLPSVYFVARNSCVQLTLARPANVQAKICINQWLNVRFSPRRKAIYYY